jgi:hypothetical protein
MVLDLHNSPVGDTVGLDLRKTCSPHGAALGEYQGSGKSYRGDMAGNRILNTAVILGYNLMEARHVLYVSYQLLLFSCPSNITICMLWPHMPEDQGLNISCTELLWFLVFDGLLARSACYLRFDL